jgi:hypothetical protein
MTRQENPGALPKCGNLATDSEIAAGIGVAKLELTNGFGYSVMVETVIVPPQTE